MRIAVRGHAHPRLVCSRGLAMRRPDFGCRGGARFRKDTRRDLCRRGRRYGKSAPANPIAALGLTWSYLGAQRDRAKDAAAIAAPRTALAALLSVLLRLRCAIRLRFGMRRWRRSETLRQSPVGLPVRAPAPGAAIRLRQRRCASCFAKRFGTPCGCCGETTECALIIAATGFWLSQAAPVRYLNKS
jgi:hypothetical protein